MQRVSADRSWPLFDVAAIRRIEQAAAAQLPPHCLMERAGLAVARLALALAPHARTVWVACGPGNNGGDGFEAAMHLRRWGKEVVVTWYGDEARAPQDARESLRRAREAGVTFSGPPQACDLAIDALLGIGSARPLEGAIRDCVQRLNALAAPVLAIDVPSGLGSDTGQGESVQADATLGLLALKPGLFTGRGRDAAGTAWFDGLGVRLPEDQACAWLGGMPSERPRLHASHKGSYGDVAIIGGAPGMTGAALLAASAALHAGAGRVFVGLLDGHAMPVDPTLPELMVRPCDMLDPSALTVACGCGGGDAVRGQLPRVLDQARELVLDADALNAIATDHELQAALGARAGRPTVMTPHPLEAARLLGAGTPEVQADRLQAAHALATRFRCVVVLKGSGSVIAAPGRAAVINATGNPRLATAGTGDVLAGMVAAAMAAGLDAFDAACEAVYRHGLVADAWPAGEAFSASRLAAAAGRKRG